MDGAAARTRRATRWVKSGLSMMTRTAGLVATTASAAARISRRIAGSRRGMAVTPTIARWSIGNRLAAPRAPLRRPRAAADARERGRRSALSQRLDQGAAEPVARLLARDDEDPQGRPFVPRRRGQ